MTLRAAPLQATVTAALILAGFGFSLAANWPGHLSYDSVIQLLEGRTAIYANWHPPAMSWLLGLGDAVLPGAGLFVAFDTALIFGSLLALVALAPRPSWAAPVVAAVLIASPQLLIYPGIVWKDVLFAATALAAFVCLMGAARYWPRAVLRSVLIASALLLLLVGALARQNGILVVGGGALSLGWIAGAARGKRAGFAYGLGALAAMAVCGLAAHIALQSRVRGPLGPAAQIRLLQVYDMTGALHAVPDLPLSGLARSAPGLARAIRTDGVRLYSPQRNDTLMTSEALAEAIGDTPPAVVAGAWRTLFAAHPLLYLRVRWAAFDWVFLTPRIEACVPFYFGVDGPAETMKALGYARRWDVRDEALDDYATSFLHTPLLNHGFFAAMAMGLLVLLLRRRRPADIAMAGLLGAALAFTASFFVISIACDYRYLYLLDLAAMAGALYAALEPEALLPLALRGWRTRVGAVWRGPGPRSSAG